MSEINFDITGTATQLLPDYSNGIQVPFELTFSVDGNVPIDPAVYRIFLPLQNFELTVNGQSLTSTTGELWGNFICSCPVYESGFVAQLTDGSFASLGWLSAAPQANTLDAALLQQSYSPENGGLQGWTLASYTTKVSDPPTSVPAPMGALAVLLWVAVAAACMRFWR